MFIGVLIAYLDKDKNQNFKLLLFNMPYIQKGWLKNYKQDLKYAAYKKLNFT